VTGGDVKRLESFFSLQFFQQLLPLRVFAMQCSGDREEAADFPFNPSSSSSSCRSKCQTALQLLVRRGRNGRSCCRSSALLVEWKVGVRE